MSEQIKNNTGPEAAIQTERFFLRFTLSTRWEHLVLFLSFTTLFLTGLPQKYRTASWSQQILATPERLELLQTIHRIAAVILILEVIYHLGSAFYQLAKRNMPADMFVTWQDFIDAGKMVAYLLFLRKEKPAFGKYNFEQKVTYWFLFFGIGIMVISGLILWFPEVVTRLLPGSVVPGAKLAHSTEAIVSGIFVVLWHFYHVHFERLNLSIFTGKMNEADMRTYHALEYERLIEEADSEVGGQDL